MRTEKHFMRHDDLAGGGGGEAWQAGVTKKIEEALSRIQKDVPNEAPKTPVKPKTITRPAAGTIPREKKIEVQADPDKASREELNRVLENFYIPYIPSVQDLKERREKANLSDQGLIDQQIDRSLKFSSWSKVRGELVFQLETLKNNHGTLPEFRAMAGVMAWEDALASSSIAAMKEHTKTAISVLLETSGSAALHTSRMGATDYDFILADAVFLGMKLGLFPERFQEKARQFSDALYRRGISTGGAGFGNTNEFRFVYLMHQKDLPVFHASPFIDRVQSPRMDFVSIVASDDRIRVTEYQGKTAEASVFNEGAIERYIHVPDKVKEVYENVTGDRSKLSPTQKREATKNINAWSTPFGFESAAPSQE